MSQHVSSKTRALVDSFISGVGIIVLLGICATCYLLVSLFDGALSASILSVVIGILAALAIVIWFLYYRRGTSTELWLPKSVAKFINGRAKVTKSNTEAFSLGVLSSFAEAPFIFALMLVAANSILELNVEYQVLAVALYTLITMVPLIVLRLFIRSGRTVVDVQRWRAKNKLFLRIVSGMGFLTLGLFLLSFKILGCI
jgi:hypothetical protein